MINFARLIIEDSVTNTQSSIFIYLDKSREATIRDSIAHQGANARPMLNESLNFGFRL